MSNEDNEKVFFGSKEVSKKDKKLGVDTIFTKVNENYDLMNDLIGVRRKIGWEDRDRFIVGIQLQAELRILLGNLSLSLAVHDRLGVIRPAHQFIGRCQGDVSEQQHGVGRDGRVSGTGTQQSSLQLRQRSNGRFSPCRVDQKWTRLRDREPVSSSWLWLGGMASMG